MSEASVARSPVLCPVVIGRAPELALIEDALESARRARGGVLFVTGEAGIGKTRLTREAEAKASEAGMTSLRGRSVHTAAPIPFRPVAEAIQSVVRSVGPPTDGELVPYRGALAAFIPEWPGTEGDVSPFLRLEAIVRLLRALARGRGLLMVLEDLHWADADTLAVVEYLADNLTDEPVVCIATIRSDEPGRAAGIARSLVAGRRADELALSRLSAEQVAQMAAAALGSEPTAQLTGVLTERSEGVPFLVEEMLSTYVHAGGAGGVSEVSAASTLPPSYSELIRSRLDTVDEAARAVITAAAVLGQGFDDSLIPAITGIDGARVLDGLRDGADAQLLSASFGSGFRFRHALVPETIVAELLPPERAELSRRAADATEAAFPGLPGEWCERAAALREDAGQRAPAATLLMEAGARALKRGALGSAEAILDRARSLVYGDVWHRMGIDRLLVDTLAQAGKVDRIEEIGASLLSFVDGKRPLIEAAPSASLHIPVARALAIAGHWDAANDHIERALSLGARAGISETIVRALGLRALSMLAAGDVEQAALTAGEVVSRAENLGLADVASEALIVIGETAFRGGDIAAAAAAFDRARAGAEAAGRVTWEIRALLELGKLDVWTGPVDRLEQARVRACATGAVASEALADVLIGWHHALRFRLDDATAALTRSVDACRRLRLPLLSRALAALAFVHAQRGDADALELIAAELERSGEMASVRTDAEGARGMLALGREDRDGARAYLEEAARSSQDAAGMPFAPGLLAVLRALAGEPDDAAPTPWAMLPVNAAGIALAGAVRLGRAGNRAAAEDRFREGDELGAAFPAFRQLGRRLVAEAAVDDGWGQPEAWLRDCIAFFDEAGIDRIASACRAALRSTGAPVPRKGRGDAAVPPELRARGLTSREMDVLALVARGLRNRDIATELFVSPRTVETHIASLFRKLEAGSRAQLIALARSLG